MNLEYTDFLKLGNSRIINPEKLKAVKIHDVSIDSRKCKKNDLFFAIKGEKYNGHDFINNLIVKGTQAIVAEKKWFLRHKTRNKKTSFILVNNTLKALGELASIYRNKFLIPVIAIAGSNGKTSTKDFVSHVLSKQYKVHNTRGNYNNAIGVPLTLFGLRDEHEMCVVEMGTNHFGEIESLCKIVQPQFGVITNIGKEHLEFLKDINGIIKEEFELVRYLKNNFGTLFLNMDDKYLSTRVKGKEFKIFSFGSKGRPDVKGKITEYSGFYPRVNIRYEKKKIDCVLSMIGKQSYESALCAASIGLFFDVPENKIESAIANYHVESKRRNELKNYNGIWILDDTYNSNPDSVKIALENIKQFRINGEKHIVLGDMLELGRTSMKEHKEIGKHIRKLDFKNLYTYGKYSYYTFLGAKGTENNYYCEDKITLIELLTMCLKKGDLVLVKGSRSMKMEEIVESIK